MIDRCETIHGMRCPFMQGATSKIRESVDRSPCGQLVVKNKS